MNDQMAVVLTKAVDRMKMCGSGVFISIGCPLRLCTMAAYDMLRIWSFIHLRVESGKVDSLAPYDSL